jgi:hypothetical protein
LGGATKVMTAELSAATKGLEPGRTAMSTARWATALLTVALVLPFVARAADDDATPAPVKHENAKKILTQSVAKLEKTKSYAVKLDVTGGISQAKDHQISETTVRETYEASLFRGLMYLPKLSAYRTAKAGAIGAGGEYQQILASKEGAKVDRLFRFPLEIMSEAAASGTKFEWLDGGERIVDDGAAEGGHTKVVRKEYVAPSRMRIEVPEQVAIQRFTTIQNSGALSGC